MIESISVGVDIVDIVRFKKLDSKKIQNFLKEFFQNQK